MATWQDTRRYFDRGAVAHLATLMPDGSPHSVPVWVGVEGDRLAVFMVEGSRKDTNLRTDPRVAISVTRPGEPFDMAFVRGTAEERIGGEAALPIIDRIAREYIGRDYDTREGMVAWLIRPTTVWAHDYSGEPGT